MLYEKNKEISNIYTFINETIDKLLDEQSLKTITPPEGTKIKTIKIVVENDGYDGDVFEVIKGKEIYHVKEKDAKKDFPFQPNLEAGNSFEEEIVDMDNSSEDSLLEYFKEGAISQEDLQKTYTQLKSVVFASGKTAKKVITIGSKPFIVTKKSLGILGRLIDKIKTGSAKKMELSRCFCLKFTEDGLKDLDSGGQILDEDTFKTNIDDQPKNIKKDLLIKFKKCRSKWNKYIKNNIVRVETKKDCASIGEWEKGSKSILDKIISKLKVAFDVEGYDVEGDEDTGKINTNLSIGEKITQYKHIELEFDEIVEYSATDTGLNFNSGTPYKFDIVGTWKDNRENTVKLKRCGVFGGCKYYIFGFSSSQVNKKNNSGSTFMCRNSKCDEKKKDYTGKDTSSVNWRGKIRGLIS